MIHPPIKSGRICSDIPQIRIKTINIWKLRGRVCVCVHHYILVYKKGLSLFYYDRGA